jgi:hypothetical protein
MGQATSSDAPGVERWLDLASPEVVLIGVVVTATKHLEAQLQRGFGAVGSGLNEKVTSVKAQLPRPVERKMRRLATLRNKVVHQRDFFQCLNIPACFLSRKCSGS